MRILVLLVSVSLCPFAHVHAQTPSASGATPEPRLQLDVAFVAGYSHDGAQAPLGFEKQGRIGQATLTLSGRLNERFRYTLSFNPVNETPSKPSCGEPDFFFPNDPRVYAAGPGVPCDPENGLKRVDTYNTFALDYIVQQGPLREGYVEWLATPAVTVRFGRFILPVGLAPEEAGSWTAKDMTRIQRLNAEANFGVKFTYARPRFDAAASGVLGEGNREKDYDWFYFANPTLDANSALTALLSARARPHAAVDLRASFKKGFTGSKVERLPSYWASKRIDDSIVVSAKIQAHRFVSVLGEYARYTWGPTKTSAEMLGIDQAPIYKAGYYVGAQFHYPVTPHTTVGATFTREEISRDDSLIKYLASNHLYGVEMGKKDRGTTTKFFVTARQTFTFTVFRADVSNPFPWVSGSWPVSGPRAFTGRDPGRYGLVVSLKASLFPE